MRDWWRPGLTGRTALLLPLSWLFGALAALRRACYRAGLLRVTRVPVPVIIVGNLTTGGSGKTPLVIALVEALRQAGHRPGVISRGYAGTHDANDTRGAAPLEIVNETDAAQSGDEPLLIRRRTGVPVFVSANRPAAAQALLAAHANVNVIISDDGLQHYALARDVEIAVFDARGAGNRRLLPAGPLREPLSRLASVTAVVHNGVSDTAAGPVDAVDAVNAVNAVAKIGSHQRFPASFKMQLAPLPCYQLIHPAETCDATLLAARTARSTLAAVAGIGDPQRFFNTLRAQGLRFSEHPLPDHHAFTRDDLATIDADLIVMTEKDALKCVAFNDARLWVLPVEAQLDPALVNLILEKLRGRQAA